MFKLMIVVIVAFGGMLCGLGPARAEDSAGSFAISAGAVFPVGVSAQLGRATNPPFVLGFEYNFPTASTAGQPFAYLDLKSSWVAALGIGYSTESLTKNRPYVGLGVSYSYVFTPVSIPSRGGVGGKVLAGFHFSPSFALEASYEVLSVNGAGPNEVGVRLKYRFQ